MKKLLFLLLLLSFYSLYAEEPQKVLTIYYGIDSGKAHCYDKLKVPVLQEENHVVKLSSIWATFDLDCISPERLTVVGIEDTEMNFTTRELKSTYFISSTKDGGKTWHINQHPIKDTFQLDIPGTGTRQYTVVRYVDENTVVVGGYQLPTLFSFNGGETWDTLPKFCESVYKDTKKNIEYSNVSLTTIASYKDIVLLGSSGARTKELLISTDKCKTWDNVQPKEWGEMLYFSLSIPNENNIYGLCGEIDSLKLFEGTPDEYMLVKPTLYMIHSKDQGKSWERTKICDRVMTDMPVRSNLFHTINFTDDLIGYCDYIELPLPTLENKNPDAIKKYKYTEDGGKTWQDMNMDITYLLDELKDKPDSVVLNLSSSSFLPNGIGVGKIVGHIPPKVGVVAGWKDYCLDNSLVLTKDGGKTWYKPDYIDSLDIIHKYSFKIHYKDFSRMKMLDTNFIAILGKGVYVYRDVDNSSIAEPTKICENSLIYPNPAKTNCTITGALKQAANDFRIEIFDIRGNKLMEVCNEKQLEGYFKFTFSTKDLPSGSYNVIIKADD
ncbi:MAG: T9SS type A sorting domain-containing protein, partial [Ignavibacteria bacterium]|nr:T9SS type A sorting domain-containing protein [Ignavibacteria bacterium]